MRLSRVLLFGVGTLLVGSKLAAEDKVENLNDVLEPVRAAAKLPVLAAVVLQGGSEVAAGATRRPSRCCASSG